MATLTQDGRPIQVQTPLGKDALLLEEISGREGVSTLFEYSLVMWSVKATIDPGDILGKKIMVTVKLADGTSQITAGIVRRFGQQGTVGALTSCTAELVPSCWVLTRSVDWRVFSNATTQDIVTKVLQGAGITDFRFALSGTYDVREYCVQYGETHMDFITRLLEEEGISYFFEHSASGDVIVFADGPSAVKPVPGLPALTLSAAEGQDNAVSVLAREDSVGTGHVAVRDFDFTKPSATLSSTIAGTASGQQEVGEEFDYPGGFMQLAAGDRRARVRLEALEAALAVVTAQSNCLGLRCGFSIDIKGTLAGGAKGPFHLLRVTRSLSMRGAYTSTASIPLVAANGFTAIPQPVPYRPSRSTPKPAARGPQTAIVTGPAGDEIYTDKYGRVKVQFHWDRVGKFDDASSCWIRVSTPMAGKQWGAVQIPRVGQEVVVTFLDGDPDRPLITGLVYNADQMPPYDLPANKTQSGLKTHSSLGGGGSNELRFEDKKDSEQVYVHAQKDLDTAIEHDESRTVGNDRTTVVTHADTRTVKNGDDTLTLENGNQKVEITQGDQTLDIAAGRQNVTIMGDRKVVIKTGNEELDVNTGNLTTKVAMGNASTSAALGKISMDGMQSIVLKVGCNSITIDQSGITIAGLNIKVNGQIQTQVTGLMTQVTASAVLQVKGALTTIN